MQHIFTYIYIYIYVYIREREREREREKDDKERHYLHIDQFHSLAEDADDVLAAPACEHPLAPARTY